jgi:amino acid permease
MGAGSQRASVLALASTAFGSGVLALPWVFSELGIVLAVFVLFSAGFASLLSQQLLANAAYATGLDSFASITTSALGERTAAALDVIIFIYTFGSCVGYFVFIEEFGPELCVSLGLPTWIDGKVLVIAFAICPLTPLCALRSLATLRYATLFSVAALVVVALTIVFVTPSKAEELGRREGSRSLQWWLQPHLSSWTSFPSALAICFYSYCCHVNLFAKYRELDAPTAHRVSKVLVRSVVLEAVVYVFVGVCGFLAFGEACHEDVPATAWPSCTPVNVLASKRFDSLPGTVARVAMIITLLVCIPLNLSAGREVLCSRFFAEVESPSFILPPEGATSITETRRPSHDGSVPRVSLVWHLFLSMGYLYLAGFVAIVYAHINTILSILGGGCAVTFMFTIPMAATLALYGRGEFPARPGVAQIGRFFGVTKYGVLCGTIILCTCIGLGYLSAVLAVVEAFQKT